jgi:hypothetical protein
MGENIPEVWLNFETAVISERINSNVINYQRVQEIAFDSGIFDELEVGILKYLGIPNYYFKGKMH